MKCLQITAILRVPNPRGPEGMWLEVTEEGGEVGELILGPPSLKLHGHSRVK